MFFKNSSSYFGQFFFSISNYIKNFYLNSNIYNKKISKISDKNLEYKPSPSLLDCLIKYEKNKKKIEDADFILCTGFLDNHEDSLDFYKNLLRKHLKLKMICTNPDLVVHRGLKKEYCAGTLASIFEEQGGKVIYFGKPYPEIYKFCIKKNERVLVIGDNIQTDIRGANNMSFDSLFIINGIHKDEFSNLDINNYDKILEKYKTKTNYYQESLTW